MPYLSDPRRIRVSDYDYVLPQERIACHPTARRDESRLLLYKHGAISSYQFFDLPSLLPRDALMVFNNTKVIQARMSFFKETGAKIEIFLLLPANPNSYESIFCAHEQCIWYCLVGNIKRWKEEKLSREINVLGRKIILMAERVGENHEGIMVQFRWNDSLINFEEILEVAGEIPIPPYLKRDAEERDNTEYQTIYSKIKGSVAAPTAGLHFTDETLAKIDDRKIERQEVTLHVGAGTFRPVKTPNIGEHEMHSERFYIKKTTIESLLSHQCKAIAVGTTSVRALESLYFIGLQMLQKPMDKDVVPYVSQWEPYKSDVQVSSQEALVAVLSHLDRHKMEGINAITSLLIAPGYEYKMINMLLTNFHLPQSTLLLLIAAFIGDAWRKVYDYALKEGFRFLSYGDSSLLIP